MTLAALRRPSFGPRVHRLDSLRVTSIAVACVSTAIAVWAIAWPAPAVRNGDAVPAPETTAAFEPPVQVRTEPEIRVGGLTARPLFRRDRRPGAKPPPPPDPAEQQRAVQVVEERRAALRRYRLSGTIITKAYKAAIIAQGNDPKMRLLRIGDDLDGWEVIDVGARMVRLRSGDEIAQLVFPAPSSPAATQATASAAR